MCPALRLYGGGMRTAAEKWALVIMLVAGALLLVAELVDHDWLGAAIWATAIAVLSWLLSRRRSAQSQPRTD
jgi:hypothetical protein